MATVETRARSESNLVQDLMRRSAWAEKPESIELRETHISWVFLSERFAYKVKKPVAFDFLDFSTPERRRQACLDEIRLNRRLAPDIYIGIVPITRSAGGRYRFGGIGKPVDWAVKMQRLPDERSLEHLIRSQRLEESDLQRLMNRLACFYSSLPPLSMPAEQYRLDIEHRVVENLDVLRDPRCEMPVPLVERVHAAQRRFLHLAAGLIDSRVCDGRIVEGHGDLRPEHIYLDSEPVIIDCIEFNRELRRIDVLDEIAFLAMECTMLGAPSIGRRIVTQFCALSGDRPGARLLALYQSYRACVRAKVLALRSLQLEGKERQNAKATALRYLTTADEFASQLGPPILAVVSGAAGTGKSTVAAGLAEWLQLTHLQTDVIRRELFAGENGVPDRYLPQRREEVYREMLRRAEELLAQRQSVVLDGTFLRQSQLAAAEAIAARSGARFAVIRCQCPRDIACERIGSRRPSESPSEATPAVHDQQLGEIDPIPSSIPQCHLDTTADWPEIWGVLRSFFLQRVLEFPGTLSNRESKKFHPLFVSPSA